MRDGVAMREGVAVAFYESSNPGSGFLLPPINLTSDGAKSELVTYQNPNTNLNHTGNGRLTGAEPVGAEPVGAEPVGADELYQRRRLSEYLYGMLGGGVKIGETQLEALAREIEEELLEAYEAVIEIMGGLPITNENHMLQLQLVAYIEKIKELVLSKTIADREFVNVPDVVVAQWKHTETAQDSAKNQASENQASDLAEFRGFFSVGIFKLDLALFQKIEGMPIFVDVLAVLGFEYVDPNNPHKLQLVRPYAQEVLTRIA